MSLSRRSLLRGLAFTGCVGLVGACGVRYTFEVEPRWLALEHVEIRLRGLSEQLSGLRIVQLSDLHCDSAADLAKVEAAVALSGDQVADLIVLTGDYVSKRASDAAKLVPVLRRLQAPLGVFGILGNHDHWTDAAVVARNLGEAGVRLLVNESVRLTYQGHAFWLVGVDDVWERMDDLPAALRPVPAGDPVVLLAHEPDFADTAAQHAVSLQLSGHSHGGQVRLPGMKPPVLPYLARKYPVGLNRVGDMWVYTNRGVGSLTLGLRFNCRPEVTVLRLAAERT